MPGVIAEELSKSSFYVSTRLGIVPRYLPNIILDYVLRNFFLKNKINIKSLEFD